MSVRKKQIVWNPELVAVRRVLNLDDGLVKQFEKKSHSLYNGPPEGCQLADKVQVFVRHLILSTDRTELVHFASLHNQAALYNTLKGFIALNIDKSDLRDHLRPTTTEKTEFMELAAQFFTLAYCQLHEPNNQKHTDRWAYRLAIDLRQTFREFKNSADPQPSASAPAGGVLITSPVKAAPRPAPPGTPPPSSVTGQVPPPVRPAPTGLPPLPDTLPKSARPTPEELPWIPDHLPPPSLPRSKRYVRPPPPLPDTLPQGASLSQRTPAPPVSASSSTTAPQEPSSNLRIADPPPARAASGQDEPRPPELPLPPPMSDQPSEPPSIGRAVHPQQNPAAIKPGGQKKKKKRRGRGDDPLSFAFGR